MITNLLVASLSRTGHFFFVVSTKGQTWLNCLHIVGLTNHIRVRTLDSPAAMQCGALWLSLLIQKQHIAYRNISISILIMHDIHMYTYIYSVQLIAVPPPTLSANVTPVNSKGICLKRPPGHLEYLLMTSWSNTLESSMTPGQPSRPWH